MVLSGRRTIGRRHPRRIEPKVQHENHALPGGRPEPNFVHRLLLSL